MTPAKLRRMLVRGAVLGALACASLLSCQERLATEDAEDHYHWCTVVNAARVYDEDGEAVGYVRDAEGDQTYLCWCLTLDEGLSGDWDAEVNDEAYEVCLESAAAMGYAEANDCAYFHSINHWGGTMFGFLHPYDDQLCDPNGASAGGCNVE